MSEPKKTDIWMPLYIGEYLADTMSFNTEQHGAYMRLLMACWREKGNALSGTDEDMATIAGLTQAKWRAMKVKVLAKFIVAEDGRVTHKRAMKEVQRAEKVSQARSEAGKIGAAKRWQKDGIDMANAMANASQNDGQSQSQSQSQPQPQSSAGTPPLVAEEVNPTPSGPARGIEPTDAGRICKAMRQQGIPDGNPSSQALRALIEAGATEGEFVEAARKAAAEQKGFGYAIAIVSNERKRAAVLAQQVHRGAMPVAETAYQRQQREVAQGLAPGVARFKPDQSTPPDFIDMEQPNVIAIDHH